MSASSRVMATNYVITRIHYKNIYENSNVQTHSSRCIICSKNSDSIRMDTCSYSCFEKCAQTRVCYSKRNNKNRNSSFISRIMKIFK